MGNYIPNYCKKTYNIILVPCNMTSECQIWDDGTYCAEGEENIKHTNKSCYCAMISQLNKISGECNGKSKLVCNSSMKYLV